MQNLTSEWPIAPLPPFPLLFPHIFHLSFSLEMKEKKKNVNIIW